MVLLGDSGPFNKVLPAVCLPFLDAPLGEGTRTKQFSFWVKEGGVGSSRKGTSRGKGTEGSQGCCGAGAGGLCGGTGGWGLYLGRP